MSETRNNWRTPRWLFDQLDAEFHFELDAAADSANALKSRYLWDALALPEWPGDVVWLNPPYGNCLAPFVRKAWEQAQLGKTVVALIPFRCRAAWWHDSVIGKAIEVRCVRKRIKFDTPEGQPSALTGTCDSCVVVWCGNGTGTTRLTGLVR